MFTCDSVYSSALTSWYLCMLCCRPLAAYYTYQEQDRDYICSKPEDNGMHLCRDIPPYKHGELLCNATALPWSNNQPTNRSCVNWNQYYTECKSQGNNPFQGTISFDNIGLAWVAIFLVNLLIAYVCCPSKRF